MDRRILLDRLEHVRDKTIVAVKVNGIDHEVPSRGLWATGGSAVSSRIDVGGSWLWVGKPERSILFCKSVKTPRTLTAQPRERAGIRGIVGLSHQIQKVFFY